MCLKKYTYLWQNPTRHIQEKDQGDTGWLVFRQGLLYSFLLLLELTDCTY